MKIVILNYGNGSLQIIDYNEPEDPEIWISRHFKLSEINWMISNNLNMSFLTSKNYGNSDSEL